MGEADSHSQCNPSQGSDKAALQSMGDRFKPVVGSQLLVDVMEVITQTSVD